MNLANEIDYVTTDAKRETIPFARMRDRSGAVREYVVDGTTPKNSQRLNGVGWTVWIATIVRRTRRIHTGTSGRPGDGRGQDSARVAVRAARGAGSSLCRYPTARPRSRPSLGDCGTTIDHSRSGSRSRRAGDRRHPGRLGSQCVSCHERQMGHLSELHRSHRDTRLLPLPR